MDPELLSLIMKGGKPMSFTHVNIVDVFPVELTVYEPRDLRHRPRSSTDGKPIVRLSVKAVRALCEREHPDAWAHYLADGSVPPLEEIWEVDEEVPAVAL